MSQVAPYGFVIAAAGTTVEQCAAKCNEAPACAGFSLWSSTNCYIYNALGGQVDNSSQIACVKADAVSAMSEAVSAGATVLQVGSTTGFEVGREVLIDAENPSKQEVNVVTGFGSLILETPLLYDHAAGASITMRQVFCTVPMIS